MEFRNAASVLQIVILSSCSRAFIEISEPNLSASDNYQVANSVRNRWIFLAEACNKTCTASEIELADDMGSPCADASNEKPASRRESLREESCARVQTVCCCLQP